MSINVLSLFDGMSCGQVALARAGIRVKDYFASETDKYAIKVCKDNYPNTQHVGDVLQVDTTRLPAIDLLIGGSPCQGFSFAGKQLNFDDPRSKLFFEYVRILKECGSTYFLFENVRMKQEYQDVISECLGVTPIEINSALVSAQNRRRLYWTNIPNVDEPEDKNINWGDVRESGIEWSPMYYSDKAMEWIERHGRRKGKKLKIHKPDEKMQMLEASHCKKYSAQRFFGIVDRPAHIKGRRLNKNNKRQDCDKLVNNTQCLEVKSNPNKTGCLTTVQKDNVISPLPIGRYPDVFKELKQGTHYRYITPIECERLQTLPDHYTASVSNTQRYKMLGNGWTVDVIAHIFNSLKRKIQMKEYDILQGEINQLNRDKLNNCGLILRYQGDASPKTVKKALGAVAIFNRYFDGDKALQHHKERNND